MSPIIGNEILKEAYEENMGLIMAVGSERKAQIEIKKARKGSRKDLKRARRNLKAAKMKLHKLMKNSNFIKYKNKHLNERNSLRDVIQNAAKYTPTEIIRNAE